MPKSLGIAEVVGAHLAPERLGQQARYLDRHGLETKSA